MGKFIISIQSKFKKINLILWKASCNTFTAHLCVNENIFLQYVLEYNFDRISFNPTKKWKIRNNNLGLKELFMENIKNQDKVAKKESDDYRHDEIRKIGPHLKHEKLNDL